MKIHGKRPEGRNVEIIAIPRPNGAIIFVAEAIESFDEFNKLAPLPTVPYKVRPGGEKVENPTDPEFLKKIEKHNELRTDWTVLKCIEKTEGLEWETVNMSKLDTWSNWRKELKEADFSEIEVGLIIQGVLKANSLDEEMIKQAKNDFLRSRGR